MLHGPKGFAARLGGAALRRSDEGVLGSFTTAFVGSVPIFRFAERSAVHAAPVAGHLQIKRLADPVHHAKRLVSRQGMPGLYDRFSQVSWFSTNDCFLISIRATGTNGESLPIHSTVLSSTGMFFPGT